MAKKKKELEVKKGAPRDLTGLGWSAYDFIYPERDPNITPATFGIYPTQEGLQQARARVMQTTAAGNVLQGGMQGMNIPIGGMAPGQPQRGQVPGGATTAVTAGELPASAYLNPAQQQPVRDYLENPKQLAPPSPKDAEKSFFQRVFDVDDEKENLGESVWDGMLKGLMWSMDRISQVTAAGISGLPGGIDTLSWDEAGEVSVGQAFVSSMGAGAGRMKRGEMTAGDWFTLPGTALSGALSMIDPDHIAQSAEFDVTNPEQRKAAFEDSTVGKITSGTLDTAFAIFGDPLIWGGKIVKVGRLAYLDRPINSQKRIDDVANNLSVGKIAVAGGDESAIRAMAPEAQLAYWASQKAEDGSKLITRSEIFNHRVIRYATNRDGLASALHNADNYDEAALVLRAAVGDLTAQADLMASRADLAIELGDAQRRLNMAKFLFNPDKKARLEKSAREAADRAAQRRVDLDNELRAAGKSADEIKQDPRVIKAQADLDAANDTWMFTSKLDESMIDPLANYTADTVEVAKRAVQQMRQRDKYFMKAYGDEATRVSTVWGSLQGSTRGFSRNNRFGRSVERSRQRRATAAYQAAATRGARVGTGKMIQRGGVTVEQMRRLHFWESDVFGNNGLTRSLRLWRWMGEETPAGYIVTRGTGAQESSREIAAMLNTIPIYSGAAKTVRIGRTTKDKKGNVVNVVDDKGAQVFDEIEIGGVAAKERLIGRYMDSLYDGTRGDQAAKLAVDRIEDQIMKDIAAWHGIDADDAMSVLRKTQAKRDDLVEKIKSDGFWVDEDGAVNQSPWLESHLQNGTFLLNYKAMEKAARLYDESGWVKRLETSKQAAGAKTRNAYEIFNEVWRPAVLMRLGYTQRNAVEGLFRASAFQFSLAPLRYAVAQGAFSVRNAYVRLNTQGAIERATVAMREASKTGATPTLPKKYLKWKSRQVAARDADVAANLETVRAVGLEVAPYSVAFKREMIEYWKREANDALDNFTELKNAGASSAELDYAKGYLDYANKTMKDFDAIKAVDDMTPDLETAMENVRFFEQMVTDSRSKRALLDDDLSAVALFRQQGLAKRRVFDGQFTGPDHVTFRQAFDENSPYTPIALMNLSADNTTRNITALRMDALGSALRAVSMRHYVNVSPDNPEAYFTGVASALRQFKNSEVGKMIIDGAETDEIVNFLRKTKEGREIAAFVTDAAIPRAGVAALKPKDYDSMVEYVTELQRRYLQLAPTEELRTYMRGADVTMDPAGRGFNGKLIEQFLGQKDEAGNFVLDLKPVVGNIAMETGFNTVRQMWAKFAGTGMKWLGTIPEDAFVRVPFYGKRYEDTLNTLVRVYQEQTPGQFVSVAEMNKLMNVAHRRALKDTKDWLYTIERRTRLGSIGEYGFPFISAAQNSLTAVGRMIWNDPSIAGVMTLIWQAPNRAGIEDERGNIVLPIPHQFIPDGLERALGLDNMQSIRIPKNALNVIQPETGFGIVPRPGPIVVAPVSEIMKHGFFGMSVESPEILRSFLGKEGADQVWDIWKDYVFGEGQGLSPEMFSSDLFTPPTVARLIQLIQGEGSSRQFAYYYNVQMRSELAKYAGGYRDEMPTADEIRDKTRGFFLLRWLGNLAAFTPPQYESNLEPLLNTIRWYEQEFGLDGTRMANENLGNVLMLIGDFSSSKNIAGMMPYANSIEASRKYANIIRDLAPGFSQTGDLSVLSMLVNSDPNAFYDDSAYAWQFANKIPGVTDYFREFQTPEMAWQQSMKNAGWTEYISRMDVIDSLLQQRGLSSLRQAGAEDLREMKNATIEDMASNPLYQGWYQDFKDFGSTRTMSAIRLMERALSDEQFVADNFDDDPNKVTIWEAASFYLEQRRLVLEAVRQSGKTINHRDNKDIRDYWDTQRQMLINQIDGWGTFANRFLNGDDDPVNPGVQFGVVYEVPSSEVGNIDPYYSPGNYPSDEEDEYGERR